MRKYFDLVSGWLHYLPFRDFALPRLVFVHDDGDPDARQSKVPLCNSKGQLIGERNLYRLQWAGEISSPEFDDTIPAEIIGKLKGFEHCKQYVGTAYPLRDILDGRCCSAPLPTTLPALLAYHLAVNADIYFPDTDEVMTTERWLARRYPHPVGAMNEECLHTTLNARFAPDAEAVAALSYLKWLAEGHRRHPLLTGFDTIVREKLMGLSEKACQLYFWLLGDYIYDGQTKYWCKGDWKYQWWRLAGYLFWTGRTGSSLVCNHAGIGTGPKGSVYSQHPSDPKFEQAVPGFLDREHEWQYHGCGSKMSQVDEEPLAAVKVPRRGSKTLSRLMKTP
jgi:hypothetical protein